MKKNSTAKGILCTTTSRSWSAISISSRRSTDEDGNDQYYLVNLYGEPNLIVSETNVEVMHAMIKNGTKILLVAPL